MNIKIFCAVACFLLVDERVIEAAASETPHYESQHTTVFTGHLQRILIYNRLRNSSLKTFRNSRRLFHPSRKLAVAHNHNGSMDFTLKKSLPDTAKFPTHGLNSKDDEPTNKTTCNRNSQWSLQFYHKPKQIRSETAGLWLCNQKDTRWHNQRFTQRAREGRKPLRRH